MPCSVHHFRTIGELGNTLWIKETSTDLSLNLKHMETHGCVVSTVATDALVLQHQAISIHNDD